jgi:outer membrane protein TolC
MIPNVEPMSNPTCRSKPSSVSSSRTAGRPPRRAAAGGLSLVLAVAVGGCADAYQRSADADVYRLLNDRKVRALGYDPQATSDPVIKTGAATTLGAATTAGTRPAEDLSRVARPEVDGKDPRAAAEENDPAKPAPARAYARIPVTPIPPSEPPALDLAKPPDPAVPLGPNPGQPAGDRPTRLDPFAVEMASRWTETRYVYGPNPPRPEPVKLDLFASLRYAVRHSRTYRARMDDLYLAALDVTLERHLLSPRPFARTGLQYTGGQRDAAYASALTVTNDVGVRYRLPYGGEVVAEALVDFVHALDGNVSDGENASLVLSGSIPLLRGAGLVNLEPLIASERGVVYTIRSFEEFRRSFAIDVANAYFQLQARYQAVNNRRVNVVNSVSLLDRTRAIYSANLGASGGGSRLQLTFLEVQRAEQQLLDAQNSLVDSQESYLNALDTFKLLIGMDTREEIDIVPVALDVTVPDLANQDALSAANRFRLDLQTARDRIDDARRGVAVANNGLLPDLNLTGRGGLGNPSDLPARREFDARALTYAAGVTLDLPLDRVAERNAYRRSLIGFYQSQRAYDELQDRVAADVRAAVRAIRSTEVSVALQRRSIELAERRLENANLQLKRGVTNARDVVEAQTALISAQDRFEQARADLQVQILQFLRQTGTLRIDPDAGTFGRALDRTAGPWRGQQERAAADQRAAADRAAGADDPAGRPVKLAEPAVKDPANAPAPRG